MTKADKYMYDMIKRILAEGTKDKDPRPKYADGTPAHTYFVNHTFRQYDFEQGRVPHLHPSSYGMEDWYQRNLYHLPEAHQ